MLCQIILQWNSHCEKSNNITNKVVDLHLDYDLILKKVFDCLNWQESKEGNKAGLPKIDESHKETLFDKWDAQLKEAEQTVEEASTEASNIINYINKNLHRANLISETTPGSLPNVRQLQTRWKYIAEEKAESIKRITKLNWNTYWQHLVKPHSQCMTLKFLTTSTEKIAPPLADSVFIGQL